MIKPPTKITENIQKPFVLINELLKGENGWWMDEINDVVMRWTSTQEPGVPIIVVFNKTKQSHSQVLWKEIVHVFLINW